MAISQDELTQILLQKFPKAIINLTSLANDEDHYSLDIQDASFNDLSLIKQHRIVKNALAAVLHSRLHAITIRTRPTVEMEK